MEVIMKDRKTDQVIKTNEDKFTCFLYENIFGRILLKLLSTKFVSVLGGIFLSSRLSIPKIKKFITNNKINMEEYENQKYKCFNDFFTRRIKEEARPINFDKNVLISPCDAKLSVYELNDDSVFKIKNSYYTPKDLCGGDAPGFENGYALVFRLCVDDYHRYGFIDDGYIENINKIKGKLHTVRPIALEHKKVFALNQREWSVLHTENFDDVIQIEVGAMMVGKIVNEHIYYKFQKGEEKGFFKFGGSTIVLLINNVEINKDILYNSSNDIETIVKYGEGIGKKWEM